MILKKIFNLIHNQQGAAALLLTVVLLTGLLAIGLTVGLVMITETKLSIGSGDSVVAYYAAESGVEHALYKIRNGDWMVSQPLTHYSLTPVITNVSYDLQYIYAPLLVPSSNISSTGVFHTAARLIVSSW
ncbi:MAG: hypothetical protein COS76_01190 [Candidatus Portnoybacteria bacterium CG06_land_8_20_14_3_00_39_12]|uniref:Type 4 fimbrial biogenesis protein PilX N-terminal domain-containing protein n=3 Tax=Candidatus Portnoyibacteriota TaxID=1817913 RepID=A0A2M8KG49_9BACT|nr:MAG: hypothetical protein AUJ33_01395 [Parcubacteria group bacterium CG1_02_40_25]PIU75372.1 MAG: hypothetical protein COS76_01190 [Candidatus Portnoybacteria bacterium CG06_land_8_20_14_3_00_39_12]PIZ71090.1 MAG: hypothetical protein COY09_01500 [Candidatus Portnoybacteria bacterium CG_4_10_14_0_2_um_filter_39_11]PJE58889.1 MAG: hypothetical protein COU83_01420 [Candidatus Portnoybacteria bacterium CG10_big_fil_rev_8_21_14_0_10_40_22]